MLALLVAAVTVIDRSGRTADALISLHLRLPHRLGISVKRA
jgi:hypothetical protein